MRRMVFPLAALALVVPVAALCATVFGLGTATCGTFLARVDAGSDGGVRYTAASAPYMCWCQGYLSALNVTSATKDHSQDINYDLFPGANEPEAVLRWFGNYCREHPLERFATACKDLGTELRKQSGK